MEPSSSHRRRGGRFHPRRRRLKIGENFLECGCNRSTWPCRGPCYETVLHRRREGRFHLRRRRSKIDENSPNADATARGFNARLRVTRASRRPALLAFVRRKNADRIRTSEIRRVSRRRARFSSQKRRTCAPKTQTSTRPRACVAPDTLHP